MLSSAVSTKFKSGLKVVGGGATILKAAEPTLLQCKYLKRRAGLAWSRSRQACCLTPCTLCPAAADTESDPHRSLDTILLAVEEFIFLHFTHQYKFYFVKSNHKNPTGGPHFFKRACKL